MRSLKSFVSTNGGPVDRVQVTLALILLVMATTLITIIYLVFWMDNPPAEINRAAPRKATAGPGEIVTYDLDWCKYTAVPAENIRVDWVGGLTLPSIPPSYANQPAGCSELIVAMPVPETLPPDTYHLHITTIYQVNPIARRAFDFEVGPFLIVEAAP